MVKIRCLTIDSGNIRSAVERAQSGAEYRFNRGGFTEVKDKDDAAFFLRAGQGRYFIVHEAPKDAAKVKRELAVKAAKEKAAKKAAEVKGKDQKPSEDAPYGLSKAEHEEALNSGTYAEVENITDKKVFDKYAEDSFDIKLNRSKTLDNMKKDFWKEWSQLEEEES